MDVFDSAKSNRRRLLGHPKDAIFPSKLDHITRGNPSILWGQKEMHVFHGNLFSRAAAMPQLPCFVVVVVSTCTIALGIVSGESIVSKSRATWRGPEVGFECVYKRKKTVFLAHP